MYSQEMNTEQKRGGGTHRLAVASNLSVLWVHLLNESYT